MGYFLLPFFLFIANITPLLVYKPYKVTEGMAIVYIAFLAGLILVLKGTVGVRLENFKFKHILIFALGVVIFLLHMYLVELGPVVPKFR